MLWQTLLFWLVFTAALAIPQGLLMPVFRLFAPESREAKTIDFALHKLLTVAYFLPVAWMWNWQALVIALVVRFAAFDPLVNWAAKDPIFYVGSTANTDKILRKTAALLGIPATVLSAILRVLGFVVLAVAMWKYCAKVIL